MEIVLDLEAETPLFAQIIAQIKYAVSSGELAPGELLPSIRQLANDLEINNKTVVKAYRLLERDSIIESKGIRGTFVRADAKVHSKANLHDWTVAQLDAAVERLREAGVTPSEIRVAFQTVMNGRSESVVLDERKRRRRSGR
jgi:GntR family transcriptional regulator